MTTTAIHSLIAVPFGHSRDFDFEGRSVTVTRTESGLHLIAEDHRTVTIHPQPNGHYILSGPGETDSRSEPVSYEEAVRIGLERLVR
ncbi:hypothetical protein ACFOYW_04810 [Gryllotalpicola reticulitermitis]|uniref:Uncharacterized protein n=1 Tax=Gryllotalpicola reticulitermitis TaxID=1184153 RepID=A0ABV8Q337_9MICO